MDIENRNSPGPRLATHKTHFIGNARDTIAGSGSPVASEFANRLNAMPGVGRALTFQARCSHGINETAYRRLHGDVVLKNVRFYPQAGEDQTDRPKSSGSNYLFVMTVQQETDTALRFPKHAIDANILDAPVATEIPGQKRKRRDDEAARTLDVLKCVTENTIREGGQCMLTPEVILLRAKMLWWQWHGEGQPGKGIDSKYEREKVVKQLENKVKEGGGIAARNHLRISAKITCLPDGLPNHLEFLEFFEPFSAGSEIQPRSCFMKFSGILPLNLIDLSIHRTSLDKFPELQINIKRVNLSNNLIKDLSYSLVFAKQLQTLDVSKNSITRIPDWLIHLNSKAEINLQGNPIPSNEIARFKLLETNAKMMAEVINEATGHRLRPKPPQILLPDVGIDLRNLNNTNVHNVRILNVFTETIRILENLYPELADVQPNYGDLERDVIEEIRKQASLDPEPFQMEFGSTSLLELAYDGVRVACMLGRKDVRSTEFPQTNSGRVLNLVWRHIKTFAGSVHVKAVMRLAQHVSHARGNNDEGNGLWNDAVGVARCDVRLIQEMIQAMRSIETGLPAIRESGLEEVFPFVQVRDGLTDIAKKIYGEMQGQGFDLDTDDVSVEFKQRFLEAACAGSVATDRQQQRYLNEFIKPLWKGFSDHM